MVNERWQPTGVQFAYACKVCQHGTDLGGDTCRKCLSEVQPGFEFDHRKYMVRQAKMDNEKDMFFGGQRGGGKIFFLEQLVSSLREQLKATEVDRDRWKSAALYYRDRYIKQKQEENNMETMRAMELRDTVEMMNSEDYKERFKAEYYQLKLRYDKLDAMTVKYEAGTLNFTPSCSLELLKEQKMHMGCYLRCLKIRAEIEGVAL